ncbi:MAG: hypothetical protein OEY33_07040 [Bdellovibrionales bacterium]|jgi:ABC-type transport system involved in multi-copper enzyme maturation permease subunit|nr:hypothetical protein [Bdellovibrionales bacterium]
MRACFTIGHFTFIQLIRSKVLINTVLIGLLLALVSFISYEISYGARSKMALDIGLGLNFLSMFGISLFLGVGLLAEEIENRTLYMAIVSPIKRWQFLLGKILGMCLTLILNGSILMVIILSSYLIMGGQLSPLIFFTILFDLLSSLIILSLVIFFSLFTNKTIAVLFTVTVVITGSVLHELALLNFVIRQEVLSLFVDFLRWLMPNFSILDIKDLTLYNHSLPASYLFKTITYSLTYLFFINMLSCIVFEKKELN